MDSTEVQSVSQAVIEDINQEQYKFEVRDRIENFDEFTESELVDRKIHRQRYNRKIMISQSICEIKTLEECKDKIRSEDKEARILVALKLSSLFGYSLYEYCKIRFDINPTLEDIRILKDLMFDAQKHLKQNADADKAFDINNVIMIVQRAIMVL